MIMKKAQYELIKESTVEWDLWRERNPEEEIDLSGANFGEACLRGTNLSRANLFGARFYGAELFGANLQGANLETANLEQTNLGKANFSGANLNRVNFDKADFYKTTLKGAYLHKDVVLISNQSILQIRGPSFVEIGIIGFFTNKGLYIATDCLLIDKGVYINNECFFGSEEEFILEVEKIYGTGNLTQQYYTAIEFLSILLKLNEDKEQNGIVGESEALLEKSKSEICPNCEGNHKKDLIVAKLQLPESSR